MNLKQKIEDHEAVVGIIGLGYVGLPLAVAFAEAGFEVVGIDIDEQKVTALNRQESYIEDVTSETLADLERPIQATTDFSVLAECDTVSVCVPTPLRKTNDPNVADRIVSATGQLL
jgi:UDP-N-acetyl-D-glucosamine dehydrogenase